VALLLIIHSNNNELTIFACVRECLSSAITNLLFYPDNKLRQTSAALEINYDDKDFSSGERTPSHGCFSNKSQRQKTAAVFEKVMALY